MTTRFIGEEPYVSMAHQRLSEIRAKFSQNPPPAGTVISAFRNEITDFPPEWQGLLLGCFVSGFDQGADVNKENRAKFIRETAYSGVGVVLILVGAGMTFLRQDMTPEQSNASCIVISAGVAAFLVFLPGFLKLNGVMRPTQAFESLTFKAGGAIAMFVLTFVLLRFAFKL
jgi:hypothetical protein